MSLKIVIIGVPVPSSLSDVIVSFAQDLLVDTMSECLQSCLKLNPRDSAVSFVEKWALTSNKKYLTFTVSPFHGKLCLCRTGQIYG